VNLVRLISILLVVSVAGLSSSFALCVSACTDVVASAAQSHACHAQTAGVNLAARDGSCPHGSAIAQQGDITRDDRSPSMVAQPTASVATTIVTASAVHTRAGGRPPARPITSRPILRI
jgi:hypothetical protein